MTRVESDTTLTPTTLVLDSRDPVGPFGPEPPTSPVVGSETSLRGVGGTDTGRPTGSPRPEAQVIEDGPKPVVSRVRPRPPFFLPRVPPGVRDSKGRRRRYRVSGALSGDVVTEGDWTRPGIYGGGTGGRGSDTDTSERPTGVRDVDLDVT